MEREDVQERTPEGIREDFHERIERLRGQARELKTLLERCERKERGRTEGELLMFSGQHGLESVPLTPSAIPRT